MHSIQIEASVHHQVRGCPPATSPPCVALTALAGVILLHTEPHTSSFLPPFPQGGFASRPSRRQNGCSITKALTPDASHLNVRSLHLLRLAFPTFRPQPRGLSLGRFVSRFSAEGYSRLRHQREGSPQLHAETGSSSYGPPVHLQLLPTPPRGDAVTFDYGVATNPRTDLHRSVKTSSRTHSSPGS
jgi:hypothetical protein